MPDDPTNITTLTPMAGDLDGYLPAPEVIGILGYPISMTQIDEYGVMWFSGTAGITNPEWYIQPLHIRSIDVHNNNTNTVSHMIAASAIDGSNNWMTVSGDIILSSCGPTDDTNATYANFLVQGIQGIPIAASTPIDGYALVYSATDAQWEPKYVASNSQVGPNQQFTFTYASSFPMTLQTVTTGQTIYEAMLIVNIPFDGYSSIQLGTTANPSLVFESSDISLSVADQYVSEAFIIIPSNDYLILSFSGSPTTGSATIYYYMR
jgi:hypothetical protein